MPPMNAPHLPQPLQQIYDTASKDTINVAGLTSQQEAQWNDTMSLMAWKCPGFRHLMYKLLINHGGKHAALPTRDVPVAATDGRNILINPDTFFKYDLRQRVFILGHEIVHNVYGDVDFLYRCHQNGSVTCEDGTSRPFRMSTMQKAMDYRINALLRDSKIGLPPPGCLLDDKIATANDGVHKVYQRLYDKEGPDDPNQGFGSGGGFDVVLKPGASTGQHPQQAAQNTQQWAVSVKEAQTIESMRTQGKMSGALSRMFEQVLNPQVPWTDKIRGLVNRKIGSGGYNWRKPDRRFIMRDLYMPGRSGFGAGHIVVWADNSGSIGTREMCHYLAEVSAILDDCRPKRLTVLWCDTKIQRIDELAEPADMAALQHAASHDGISGGGGTSCKPVFDWIRELDERPEAFIGFTDGYVSFPAFPDHEITCIWASVAKKPEEYPFGDVVMVDTRKN